MHPDLETRTPAGDDFGTMVAVQIGRDDLDDRNCAADGLCRGGRGQPDVQQRRLRIVEGNEVWPAVAVKVCFDVGTGSEMPN